jgi:hypothetical protein
VRRRRSALSAATTPHAIAKALENGQRPPAAARAALEQLRGSLEVLAPAGYGRSTEVDLLTLNTALDNATDAVRQLRWRALLPTVVMWRRDD